MRADDRARIRIWGGTWGCDLRASGFWPPGGSCWRRLRSTTNLHRRPGGSVVHL